MLYYLLHQSPIWTGLSNGKRNVRILVICIFLYIVLSYLAREYTGDNIAIKMFSRNFFYFMIADIFVNAINYKIYYGRSVVHELMGTDEKKDHVYVKKRHKYYDKDAIQDVILEDEINDVINNNDTESFKVSEHTKSIKSNDLEDITKKLYKDHEPPKSIKSHK